MSANSWLTQDQVPRATRRPLQKAPDSSDEEGPDEQSVPEGPPAGAAPYRRGSARSSRPTFSPPGSAGALSEYSPRQQDATLTNAYTTQSPAKPKPAPVQRAVVQDQPESSVEEDSFSTPIGTALPAGRRSRPASAVPQPQQLSTPPPTTSYTRPTPPQPAPPLGNAPLSAPRPRAPAPTAPPPAAPAPRLAAPAPRPVASVTRASEILVEDFDDLGLQDESYAAPVRTATVAVRGAAQGYSGAPLASDAAREFTALLWGAQGAPPPSWKQGFFFSETQGLTYGLVQLEGGPCGVLASVQAYVLANLRTADGSFQLRPHRSQQDDALVCALADILWQARIGPVAYVAAAAGEGGGTCASLGYDQLMRAVVLESADNKDRLQDLIRQRLPCYTDGRGWGLILLLISLIQSHGVGSVRGAMDEPSNALMGMHGYCTQELVNLLITGQACTNVFDGNRDLDGTLLHGVTRRCRVGLLTLFEWYKYVEVGRCLKSPDLPIWVVCSESHFTVLFAHDQRAMRNDLPFDLHFYDELANQQAPIVLTISHEPEGGWTARVGDSLGDRGKCEGQNIPPLECVIETRWPGVHVNWNGTEPIL